MTEHQKMTDAGIPPILATILSEMGLTVEPIYLSDDSPEVLNVLRTLRHSDAPDPRETDGTVNLNHTDIVDLMHALLWVHNDLTNMTRDGVLNREDLKTRALVLDGKIHGLANKLMTVLDYGSPMTSVPF